jgi:mannose-6-phosphate isomerase-like protein (cupin superfamily)
MHGSKPTAILLAAAIDIFAADPFFLRRSLSDIHTQRDDLTVNAKAASYKPVFGIGDKDADKLQSVARYGELTIGPGGSSAIVSYPAEEQIYYILEGQGMLFYDGQNVPIKKDDFIYLPVNVRHGIANTSNAAVRVVVMGYRIPAGRQVVPTPKLSMANANDVQAQTLPTHGPTTQFKLLMGHHYPEPDKVTASSEVTSLFIMDFAPGGTNIPHTHATEEEIYLLLRGHGDVVAGKMGDGQDARHPSKAGDVFFFAPNTEVGYYSGAKEGQEHDVILAVRSRCPVPVGGAGAGQ